MTYPADPTVHIVDNDPKLRDAFRKLLESVGLKTAIYTDTEEFLECCPADKPGCLLLDVYIPGVNSLHRLTKLPDYEIHLPVIIVTGCGSVAMVVAAMKNGAVDFIEKPCNDQQLLDCVQNALAIDQASHRERHYRQRVLEHQATLTPREREVMQQVVQGIPNRLIAESLCLSSKTVEVHRARVMSKMQAKSLAELIRMAIASGMLKDFGEENQS